MTIDQHRQPEMRLRASDQRAQRGMVGVVQPVDSRDRPRGGDRSLVDGLGLADDARNGAQTAGDAQNAC